MTSKHATAPPPRADWFSDLFGFAEESYEEAQRWLRVVPNSPTEGACTIESQVNGACYNAGAFATPSLAELRKTGHEVRRKMQLGSLKVSNEMGDVAQKHTQAENRFATFQVASQFNCLEFVGPEVAPEDGVTKYIYDKTQGPACSVACGPATVYRNYFAPVHAGAVSGKGQTRHRQIDNLADVSRILGNTPKGQLFDVKGGYTLANESQLRKLDISLMQMTEEGKLDDVRAALRVGVHSDVQVTSCNWGLRRVRDAEQVVSQVFGSACAVAYNGRSDSRSWRNFASIILEASYEATLWAALLNSYKHGGREGSRRVFLTCLGGGVFGNSMSWIMQAMRRAFDLFQDCDLDVRVVTYAPPIDPQLVAIASDVTAKAAAASEKKRSLADEAKDGDAKRQKLNFKKLTLPDSASILPGGSTGSTAGELTPAVKKKEVEGCPSSPPKADSAPSVGKRTKGRAGKAEKAAPQVVLDATVLAEAVKLDYAGPLQNLASRPEMIARGVSSRVMLEALKRSDGLVNKAKASILGA